MPSPAGKRSRICRFALSSAACSGVKRRRLVIDGRIRHRWLSGTASNDGRDLAVVGSTTNSNDIDQGSIDSERPLASAHDSNGSWDLTVLSERSGETGAAARDVAGALNDLGATVTDFSIGAARSAVSVRVIETEIEHLHGNSRISRGGRIRSGTARSRGSQRGERRGEPPRKSSRMRRTGD